MKLVRFGAPGAEKPGLVDAQGAIRDLSGHVKDITGDALSPAGLDKLRKIDPASLPAAPKGVRLGPPVGNVRNFIAVGLNYIDHAKETGSPIPKEPILFNKLPNCIVGPNDDVMVPKGSTKLDYEVEIAFVIGTRARYVDEKNALSHIAGYCICNDVSERNFQSERGGQWMKGKCAETFGPLGPWLVTTDEIKNVQNLAMSLDVNGQRRQTGNTETMIFGIAHLLHYITQFMVLEAGDVVTTGTPPGVALGMKPPVWLKPGDMVKLSIQGLGEQQCKIVPFKE
jgi:2-keto-4-pentenoate hydratase/2-oxohepta-3-ene-1,7-dioic acid hydratase in catechol pathway